MSNDAELLAAITAATDASMVTRYLVIAECIGEDGEPYIADLTSPGMPYYVAMGMAHSVLQSRGPQPAWHATIE